MPTQLEATSGLNYSQKGRAISVEVEGLGAELLLESFEGKEVIAGGFKYTLGLLSKDPSISGADVIRKKITVMLHLSDGSDREINGLVSRFVQLDQAEGLTVYEAEMRPWYWFLSLTSDYRIWQGETVPSIVKAVCSGQGFSEQVTFRLTKNYKPHEYKVQYGESHLDFITRLMEEEGLFWFADHADGESHMIVADDNSVAKTAVKLRMSTIGHDTEDEAVLSWFNVAQNVRPQKFTAIDYNFEKPALQLRAEHSGKDGDKYEVVEFPGGFDVPDGGTSLARVRHQAMMAEQVEAEGAGRCRALKAGGKIEVSKHPNKALNRAYLVTSVKQSAKLGDFRTGGDPGLAFESSFTAIPFDTPYKPERSTEARRAYGYESAVVVGPSGSEIHTDAHGRVKVQFFWDRLGKKDDKSSCWIRVATMWAGPSYGAISTPRVGHEVLVAYVNGDPEDPIIVGSVYHGTNVPPYALPAEKTKSTMKSNSSTGGGGSNEIRFEDKKGSEEVYIHAQKDKNIVVEHNRSIKVGNDNVETVSHDESINVGRDQTLSVGGQQSVSVSNDRSKSVGGSEKTSIEKNRTESVGETESVTIGKDRAYSIDKKDSLTVGEDRSTSVGKNDTLDVTESRKTTIGKDDQLEVGKTLTISVEDEITLKTGDASITMKKNGEITIKGKDIKLDGSGSISVKASSDLTLKGSKVDVN